MERLAIGTLNHVAQGRISENVGRLSRYWKQRGALATLRFLVSRLFRFEKHVVYETTASTPRGPVTWGQGEQVVQFGPENLDGGLTPELRTYLGGGQAYESLCGVRNGDRLFVIALGGEFVHRGYILFKTRQSRILGDDEASPLIAYCSTSPAARGRGLYRRALETEVAYLLERGYRRVLIETDPENHASRKGIEAAGFTFAWEASVWILLNWFIVRRNRSRNDVRWRVFTV